MPIPQQDMFVDEFTCLNIAKGLSPFDTGNLRYNAIKSKPTNDGFVIIYSLQDAYYIRLLEEGITTMKHYGFIANKTVPAIASYFAAKYQERDEKRLQQFYTLESNFLNSGFRDEDTVSRFNKETRSERHNMSMGMDLQETYSAYEMQGFTFQKPNVDLVGMQVSYLGRGL